MSEIRNDLALMERETIFSVTADNRAECVVFTDDPVWHRRLSKWFAPEWCDGRAARYRRNHQILVAGMRKLGFQEYLAEADQGYIITSFLYPPDERFTFDAFYSRLNARGFAIYPGKVSNANCFRIGHIGHLFEQNMHELLQAIADVCQEMAIQA